MNANHHESARADCVGHREAAGRPLLNRALLHELDPDAPDPHGTDPTRVIQFGGGNFLRAFFDDMLDEARRRGRFAGRAALVLSHDTSRCAAMREQDGAYVMLVLGQRAPRYLDVFSEVLHAREDHARLLELARDPRVDLWTSNVTAAALLEPPAHDGARPANHAARVADMLAERAGACPLAPLTLLCLELTAVDNGPAFRGVLESALRSNPAALRYLNERVATPATLVDRVAPGHPKTDGARDHAFKRLGCEDRFLVAAEEYRLLAIGERTPEIAWMDGLRGVTFPPDLARVRDIKLRLLNGAHTALAPLGIALGMSEVANVFADPACARWLNWLLWHEVLPTLSPPRDDARAFLDALPGRLAAPELHHRLHSIMLNHSVKMGDRWRKSLAFHRETGRVPAALSLALAASMHLFSRCERWSAGVRLVLPSGAFVLDDPRGAWIARWAARGDPARTEHRRAFLRAFFQECRLLEMGAWDALEEDVSRRWAALEERGPRAALDDWAPG